jgi:CDP-diacylglycerol--glycerol-3-phosphate 3-phosphatidyltransferase
MIFTTSIPDNIDKFFNIRFFSIYGLQISTGIFIIAAVTDKLDGYIARKYNQITKLGIFLDPLVDKLLITCGLIYLVQIKKIPWWLALIIIFREIAVTDLRLVAMKKGLILAADNLGKIKMVFQVIAIIIAMLDNYPLSLFTSFKFDILIMYIAAVLTVYSGIHYFKVNWKVFKKDKVYKYNA